MSRKTRSLPPRWRSYLLLAVLAFITSAGMATALGFNQRPRPLGYVLLALGLTAAVFTVNQWSSAVPVLVGTGILNSFITLCSGHALNQPDVPASRPESALFLASMIGAAVTISKVSPVIRTHAVHAAYLGMFACVVAPFTSALISAEGWGIPTLVVFIACVVLLWATGERSGRHA